ncbi:MAG TPA: hypothetical protein VKV39_17900 [Candidatus Sulfotelmatobacter sp.]|nr:hypothetical protein [Candidatus Sulfotelmatobacter sp.]
MTSPFEIARHWWEFYRERPFLRLVRLFVARIFRGGGDADTEGVDLGIGLVLTLLAMPGGFVSLMLLDKYGTLLQWMRGTLGFDPLVSAFPDEYFFIVLSMVVTGAVAVWRWDAIFPDRRDFINLVPLPISTRTIFFANFVAVIFLTVLIAVDVNAASCVLFPAVVGATQTKFAFFFKFAIVHAAGVLLASVFAFLAVFSFLGILMAILPPRGFRRISAFVRGVVVVYLVTLLCTSFAVPDALIRVKQSAPAWTLLMPSCWFLSLCQMLRGRGGPAIHELGRLAIPGTAALAVAGLGAYAIAYRRHFMRIPEMGESTIDDSRRRSGILPAAVRSWFLHTPFQRGCYGFVWKTLARNESHRLVMTAVGGLALVLASQALMQGFEGAKSAQQAALSPDALAIPYILTFLLIIGLRVVFEVPVELRSNWIFQLTLDREAQECVGLGRKVILGLALPLVVVVAFPVYVYLEDIRIAALHTLVVGLWTVLLTNILLIRFRKVPFTCTLPVFKQHSIVILLGFCFGYLIYAVSIPEFEASALLAPWRLVSMVPAAAVAWYIPRHLDRNTIELDRRLIFEETAVRSFELLELGE